ncbi:hypothetical protein PHMEG_00029090 [Phytophthora megakarya]|uniref:Uncharacterized protein n=1 Tax=Phytophthora megakarya TaxID=4795 RepID=A0A225V5Z2_9STRA|nr:hypothetical protein PHMEG_00029090 [Phytophthora megakarya]
MTFSHTYLVLAWNLMCRSSNAFRIRHSHMEWRGDALKIYYERFRKSLRRILAQDDFVAELSRQGLKATELGPHSMWKDAATFCSSHHRQRFICEQGGHWEVSRTHIFDTRQLEICTLDALHLENLEKCVKNGVQLMFPGIPERREFVAEYCFALLVCHYSYLKETLSPEHQLF